MENLNSQLLEKAREANSAEEILDIAKQNNLSMTEEQAKAAYAQLHPVSGEIADDELENVAGGGCGERQESIRQGNRVYCSNHRCPKCGSRYGIFYWQQISVWSAISFVKCENDGECIYNGINPGKDGVRKA